MLVLLALLSSLLWGVSDFLGGTATRRLRAAAVVGGSQGIALLGLLAYVVAAGQLADVVQDPSKLLPGLAAGVIGAASLAAFYAALAEGTMGVIAPIAALGTLLPVVVGLARGEAPSLLQLVGIAVAISSPSRLTSAANATLWGASRRGAGTSCSSSTPGRSDASTAACRPSTACRNTLGAVCGGAGTVTCSR